MIKAYANLSALLHVVLVQRFEEREEKGATAVEYGLLVGLIAVAIIVAVTALGGGLSDLFEGVKDELPSV